MTQFALPFEEPRSLPTPSGTASGRDAREVTEDDAQSSEEIRVEGMTSAGADRSLVPAALPKRAQKPQRRALIIRGWPAALTWADALDYTSCSAKQLRRWQKTGALRFRRIGRSGAMVVMRSELDQLLEQTFAPPSTDISEDFDFG